jgi:hypothetical protein
MSTYVTPAGGAVRRVQINSTFSVFFRFFGLRHQTTEPEFFRVAEATKQGKEIKNSDHLSFSMTRRFHKDPAKNSSFHWKRKTERRRGQLIR